MKGFLLAVLLIKQLWFSTGTIPIVINTWAFEEAAERAWRDVTSGKSSLDSLENGLRVCQDLQCDGTVGYGGSPDENGETTLDGMIFDGVKMDMGAIGGLRRVKDVIGVARLVLDHTTHSFLVGDQATMFALQMGFKDESLTTNKSCLIWKEWKKGKCQPNYWQNVEPNPNNFCGPYRPNIDNSIDHQLEVPYNYNETNHDTISMIVIDSNGYVVAGTSTNGASHKIPGRVGDSPIPGAGAYADADIGAAAATGDGDLMMRFLPSFVAIEEMRHGSTPLKAARTAIARIAAKYPKFFGALVVANKKGEYGAACNGFDKFPFSIANKDTGKVVVEKVPCTNTK